MKRTWLIAGGLVLTVLLASGAWAGMRFVQFKQEEDIRRLTPNLLFNFTRQSEGSPRYCFDFGWFNPDEAPLPLTWEQFFIHEYREQGPRDYPVPGLSGVLRLGERTCGFEEFGYYDFVYKPTMHAAYLKYPGCGGNPDAAPMLDGCHPPRDWPQ